jgi:hypothetical protein
MNKISMHGIRTLSVSFLLLITDGGRAVECKWIVQGRVAIAHQLPAHFDNARCISALPGIEVRVSSKTRARPVWGPYHSWGMVRTDAGGFFSITAEKGCGDHQFKIEVRFFDDAVGGRDRSSRQADGGWFTIIRDTRYAPGIIDLGQQVFQAGGAYDLGNPEAREQAILWKLRQQATETAKVSPAVGQITVTKE